MTTSAGVTIHDWAGPVAAGETRSLPFFLHKTGDLEIISVTTATSVETPQATGPDYTVLVLGEFPTITTVAGIAAGDIWKIKRVTVEDQDLDLDIDQSINTEALERALDKALHISEDLREELNRCLRVPAGEHPADGVFNADNVETRKGKFPFWDAGDGSLTIVDGVSTVPGTVVFTANGTSLVAATNAGMRTQLDLDQRVVTTIGDLILGTATAATRLAAAANPGRVLMASDLALSESGGATNLDPRWGTPWGHPFDRVEGFECAPTVINSPDTHVSIGRGYAQPLHRTGASGAKNSYTTDGKEMRIGSVVDDKFQKNISSTWASGSGNGGRRQGLVIGNDQQLNLFAMGREQDEVSDLGFDDNALGTGLVADAIVKLWHDDAGSKKLFLRRIRTYYTDGTADLVKQHSVGDWVYYDTPLKVFDGVVTTSDVPITLRTCPERTIVKLMMRWQGLSGEDFFIRSGYDIEYGEPRQRANGTDTLYFTAEVLQDEDRIINMTTNGSTRNLEVFVVGYYDPRGHKPEFV